MSKKRIKVTDGGNAIPLGNNYFLMRGRTHEQGGIGIGKNKKNSIEVENGEIIKVGKKDIKVFSDQPMLNGISPADALLMGGNPKDIFAAQQAINGNSHGSYAEKGVKKSIVEEPYNKKLNKKEVIELSEQINDFFENWIYSRSNLLNNNFQKTNTKIEHITDQTNSHFNEYKMRRQLRTYDDNGEKIDVSKIAAESEINNINRAKFKIKGGNSDASGYYRPWYHNIIYMGKPTAETITHEKAHSIIPNVQEAYIKDVIFKDKDIKFTPWYAKHYTTKDDRASELYSGKMVYSFIEGLDPNQEVTMDYIKNVMRPKINKESNSYYMFKWVTDEDLYRIFNEVADNRNTNVDDKTKTFYAKNGGRVKYDRGGISWLIDKLFGGDNKENNNKENKKDAPIDWDEIKIKQAYAESGFNSKAVSKAPAYGLYQITPQTLKEFNDKTGNTYKIEDLYNDKINTEIRDWYMNDLYNREWNTKNNPSDSVRATKTIMAYNMGPTNLVNRLNELKDRGYNIYQSLDWTQDDSIPAESREYNDFILRNIDNSISRNKTAYEASKKKNFDKVEGIRKGFKNGGQINMKLKNKNKQDITDIVMNEILPSSTGKRKKFVLGGSELALIGNAGLNFLSGIGQGIAGSINANKLRKMYDGLKRQSTFIPVAREHINTKVDVEPQLNLTAQTEYNLRKNAEMNTSNAKVARSQARVAALDRIRQDNVIYSDKYNKETQLRNAEAELQTRYNLVDAENKLTDIREQNDFDMQKAIGKANASTMEAQTWGNAIASTLKNTATSLMDYTTMKNDLLKSNNPEAYKTWFSSEYGHLKNKIKNSNWATKNQKWIDANRGILTSLGWLN